MELFYNLSNGEILSPSGRVLDTAETLTEAASMFPGVYFRLVHGRKYLKNIT